MKIELTNDKIEIFTIMKIVKYYKRLLRVQTHVKHVINICANRRFSDVYYNDKQQASYYFRAGIINIMVIEISDVTGNIASCIIEGS